MTDVSKELLRLVEQWDATAEFDTDSLYLFTEALVGAARAATRTPAPSDVVEAVARAICRALGFHPDYRLNGGDNLKWTEFDGAAKAAIAAMGVSDEVVRLWLWRNFVGGKPEYWAFDNPFPCHDGGDPMTFGQPCGWALFKRSNNGRPDVPASEVEAAIHRALAQSDSGDTR